MFFEKTNTNNEWDNEDQSNVSSNALKMDNTYARDSSFKKNRALINTLSSD